MNYNGYLEYEIVDKPYRGSLKRARVMLSSLGTELCAVNDFIRYIQIKYPKLFRYIEFIRFYDYNDNMSKDFFHYRIAMIFTAANESIRAVLYNDSETITNQTGWYPLITGSRSNLKSLNFTALRALYEIGKPVIHTLDFGQPHEIVNISENELASAILLKCSKGNILFDTGFSVKKEFVTSIDLICISHYHKDHVGGLVDLLHARRIPVLLSSITLMYLIDSYSEADKITLLSCATTLEEIKGNKSFSMSIEFFQVFHAPGSFAFVYKYRHDISVIYLGDICLRNTFYNGTKECINNIVSIKTARKTVICDTALVGKKEVNINDDTPSDLIKNIASALTRRNTIFISNSFETLLYCYLILFMWVIKNKGIKVRLIVSDQVYSMLKLMSRPMIYRREIKDLFIDKVIKMDTGFAETYRLYPLSTIGNQSNEKDCVFFTTTADLEQYQQSIPIYAADIVMVGIWAGKDEMPAILTQQLPRSITRVSSVDWSFHSSASDVLCFTQELFRLGVDKILYYHNYPSTIHKYIKQNNIASFADSISKNELPII